MSEIFLLLRGNQDRRLLPTNEIPEIVGYLQALINLEYLTGQVEVHEIRREKDLDIVIKNNNLIKEALSHMFKLDRGYTLFKVEVLNPIIDAKLYGGLTNRYQLEGILISNQNIFKSKINKITSE